MSSNFLSKVQGFAAKKRSVARGKSDNTLDDAWLYEEAAADDINYYDNSVDRVYDNPKRETGRKSRTAKRTFGYQIPTHIETVTERPLRRIPASLTYRRNRTPKKPQNKLIVDVIKQEG